RQQGQRGCPDGHRDGQPPAAALTKKRLFLQPTALIEARYHRPRHFPDNAAQEAAGERPAAAHVAGCPGAFTEWWVRTSGCLLYEEDNARFREIRAAGAADGHPAGRRPSA